MKEKTKAFEVFLIFLRLGFTSFGGPIAHLGYFRDEFVTRRRWLTDQAYADIVALCQFLPGPASSQVGIAIGILRSGMMGAFSAFLGFTLPSAAALTAFALGLSSFGEFLPAGALHGFKIVAVAVVAQAVWGMAKKLCTDELRKTFMAFSCCAALLFPSAVGQISVIVIAGLLGFLLFRSSNDAENSKLEIPIKTRTGIVSLSIFLLLLIALPVAAYVFPSQTLARFDAFYRAGSLVFGGGHVVLPLLQSEVVSTAWVSNEAFLAGYGAAQAVPGPLFTLAAFLGASMQSEPTGILGASVCLLAIFLPSFLLVIAALPFWEKLRHNRAMQQGLAGINAAVVGLLLAALYSPVWTSAIFGITDFCLGLLAFSSLVFWRLPPWLVVFGCSFAASIVAALG